MRIRSRIAATVLVTLVLCSCYKDDRGRTKLPDYVPTAFAANMNQKAIESLKAKRFEDALQDINQALDNDPKFYLGYTNKAIILGRLGRFEEAAETLRRCIEVKPDFSLAHLYLGLFLEKMGDKTAAGESYLKAIELYDREMAKPDVKLETRMHRAVAIYLARGKTIGTREVNKILELYPEYAGAGLLRDRMLTGDRDFFMWWLADAAAQSD